MLGEWDGGLLELDLITLISSHIVGRAGQSGV